MSKKNKRNYRGTKHPKTDGRTAGVRIGLTVGTLLIVLTGFGVFAAWKNSAPNLSASGSSSAPPLPTPQYAANAPAKEYVYGGGKLVAVSEPVQPAPTDLAVWRPGNGTWYIYGTQTTQTWGLPGDIPVPGDYDGDEKTDFSVFRPDNNRWYIMYSSNSYFFDFEFGLTGDKTAQADYDGDGKTDAAVFRPPTGGATYGVWYVQGSLVGFYTQTWGISGDVPASADHDSDGKADFAVWRPSNSTFYSINSSNQNLQTVPIGQSGVPVSADYDGDGKADYAIFDAAATPYAKWHIRSSISGTITTSDWGLTGDKPVQNDYDADGKVDVAVWRNSNGVWYIKHATGTIRETQWGLSGDIPVPAFYRR